MSSPSPSPSSPQPPSHFPSGHPSPSSATPLPFPADERDGAVEASTSTSTRPTRNVRRPSKKMKEVSSDEDDDEAEAYRPPKPVAKSRSKAGGRKSSGIGGLGGARKSTAKEEGAPVIELTNRYKDKFMDLKSRFEDVNKTKTARTQALEVALERLNKVQLENDAYLQTLALSLDSRPSLAYALERSRSPIPPPSAPSPQGLPIEGWSQHDSDAMALAAAAGLVASAASRGGGVDGDAGLLLGLQANAVSAGPSSDHAYYGADATNDMLAHQQIMSGLGHSFANGGGYGMEALSVAVEAGAGEAQDGRSAKRVKLE